MPIVASGTRATCDRCGGWVDVGVSPSTWTARLSDFAALHAHQAGAPQVYNVRLTEADRDAFAAVVDGKALTSHGYAPLGGNVVAFVSSGASSIRDPKVVRIIASSPAGLAASLP